MGFFDEPPPPEDEEEDEIVNWPADHWLAGVVPIEEVMGRSDRAAIAARRIAVFEDGIELEVVVWVRKRLRSRRRGPFHSEILLDEGGMIPSRYDDGDLVAEFVRFGVQFPDGAKVTNFDYSWPPSPDATEPMHGMDSGAGGGSDSDASQQFWIWPIPETGDLTLVCEWPAYGIPESHLTINGDVIRDAVARSLPVWPDQAATPVRPGRRRGGWSSRSGGRMMEFQAPIDDDASQDPPSTEGEVPDDAGTD